jgi:hypothetical protein
LVFPIETSFARIVITLYVSEASKASRLSHPSHTPPTPALLV